MGSGATRRPLPLSQNQTSALAAILHSLVILSSQDRFGAEGADQAGGAACGERGEQARGQRLSEIDGGREEFGGKLLGPINPSELCFPLAQSGSAATVSLRLGELAGSSQSRHSPVTDHVVTDPCARAVKYTRHRKAATASF